MKKIFCLILMSCFILSGCSAIDNMPRPPKVTPIPTEEALPETGASAAALPSDEPAPVTEPDEEPVSAPDTQSQGVIVRVEQNVREAFDPEAGTERILYFTWDDVEVESPEYPEAAEHVTETLAVLEDEWYTGSNSGEGDIYGYDSMLSAAEDNYGIAREYGGAMECSATRDISVLRADDEVLVFALADYFYLGGAHGSYSLETLCFDAKTGEQLTLDTLSGDAEALRGRLLAEMLNLAAEDKDGYYSDHLDLTEPENYEASFAALLRDGAWELGKDAFCISSSLYELGSYAAGITEFSIPYDTLSDIPGMDRWIPKSTEESGTLRIAQVADAENGSVEIVDRVVIGDGGETFLLAVDGSVKDFRIRGAYYSDRFYPDGEFFYCSSLRDAAVQLAMLIPEGIPETMISYRDASGEHEYVISYSGTEGTAVLIENGIAAFG